MSKNGMRIVICSKIAAWHLDNPISEFINIRVVDLRLDLDPPQVYLAHAKGRSDGYVPILPTLAQEFRTHLPSSGLASTSSSISP